MSDSIQGTPPDPAPNITRRRFIQAGAVGAASALGLAALGQAGSAIAQAQKLPIRYAGTKKTTLTLVGLFFIPTELAAARQIINEFNAQSKNIFVQYEQSSWGAIATKMTASFSSGDVPDLFQYYDAGLVPWAANGLLADLKKLMPASTWTNVVPGTLSVLTTASKGVIGLPFETETPVIYYRTDLLSKAGINPATLTSRWTWDQLRENAVKLNDPKNGVFGINANWSSSELLFKNGLAWEAGANPIKVSNGSYSIDVNDPGTRAAIEYVRSLFANGTADPHSFDIDNVAYFAAGHCAMLLRGAWARSDIPADKGGSTLKWAIMPFVQGPKANLGTGAAQALSIPSISKNKEAAAEFLSWWGKPANVAKICQASGQVPPNTAAVAMLKSSVGTTDFWNVALAESPDLQGEPFCPGWLPMLGTVWDPAMFNYYLGKSNYAEFATKVNSAGTQAVQLAAGI
jgi:ABC-type glycerol-3-phosphate transport system substrate-binding protein